MKRIVAVFSLGVLLLATLPARSDDVPHLEFVRALRAHGYNEEAYEYLQSLAKRSPSKDVLAFVPLEKAITRLNQAMQTPDANERANLFQSARAELDNVIKDRPDGAFAAVATLEKARIGAIQGRILAVKARLAKKDDGGGKDLMQKAHDTFVEAEGDLDKAIKTIEGAQKKENSKAVDEMLKSAKGQADFELAANQIDQACTYEALNKNGEVRGKMIDKAIKSLGDIYEAGNKDTKNPIPWQARAWRARGYSEVSKIEEAKKDFAAIENKDPAETPSVAAGRREAMFFHFQVPIVHPDEIAMKMGPKDIQKLGEQWLKENSAFANTFDGNYVRMEIANIYKAEGMAKIGDKPNPPKSVIDAAKPSLQKAADLYGDIASTENEFKADAAAGKFDILLIISENVRVTLEDIDKLTKFDDVLTMVDTIAIQIEKEQHERYVLEKKDKRTSEEDKKLETMKKEWPEYRKAQFNKVEYALSRALAIADPKAVNSEKLGQTRAKLVWVAMENGNPFRAAVLGDTIARTADKKSGSEAVQAAAYALQAYAMILAEDASANLDKSIVDVDRERFRSLAKMMEDNWPKAPETNAARHQVGALLLRDAQNAEAKDSAKLYIQAEEMLSRVTDSYNPAGLTDARYWWSVAAQRMLNEDIPDAKKKYYKEQAIKALKGIPENLPNDVSPQTAQAFVLAKLQYGGILYENKQFADLEKLGTTLKGRLGKFGLDDKVKEGALKQANYLIYLASFGKTNALLHDGKPDKLDAALAEAKKVKPVIYAELTRAREPEKALRTEYGKMEQTLIKDFGFDPAKPEDFPKKKEEMSEDKKKKLSELEEKMKDTGDQLNELTKEVSRYSELYRGLLTLSLRASLLKQDTAGAKLHFADLRKAAKEDGAGTQTFVAIVAQLRKQVEDLKQQPDKVEELKAMQRNFTALLKPLSEEPELNPEKIFDRPDDKKDIPENPRSGMIFFLVESYSSLDQHGEAAAILKRIPKPKFDAGQKAEVRAKDEGLYHYAQMRLVKELRLGGAADPKSFDEARKLLEEIRKQDWGKGIDVKKEDAQLWHDQKQYGAATTAWVGIVKDFGQRPDFTKAKVREEYFEAYFHFLDCKYKYAILKDDPRSKAEQKDNKPTIEEKRKKLTQDVAKAILDMETNTSVTDFYRQKIEELLKKSDPLRKEYEQMKKANTAAASN